MNPVDSYLYYRSSDGVYYYIGRNASEKLFTANHFDGRFIIGSSPLPLNFSYSKNRKVGAGQSDIIRPMRYSGTNLIEL
jgi:hypothetical protein